MTTPPPGRAPTQRDVARHAGVSRALVSMVIRGVGPVSEDKHRAVTRAIAELGYRANAAGQLLASRQPRVIGVVARSLVNPFYGEVLQALQAAALTRGYRTLVESSCNDPTQERSACESLLGLRIAGLALIAPLSPDDDLARLARQLPLVVIGRDTSAWGIDSVEVDEHHGGRLATDHLIERGHRAVTYVDAAPHAQGWSSRERRAGFLSAMADAGLSAGARVVAEVDECSPPSAAELLGVGGRASGPDGGRATAVFAHDDLCAIGVERVLRSAGLSIPGDVAVVGYDDTRLAAIGPVGLTSVHQPCQAEGHQAAEALLRRIEDRGAPGEGTRTPGAPLDHRVLTPHLVVREST
ncbi:transcriptional regulator, LacI family [Austwickia chelonae]|nr:LacI family DNA-binding transcriptional regulator [Austwickia chelonae]SEW38105.1 transcriptional regulator, LacI family [Austwickia chelonae]